MSKIEKFHESLFKPIDSSILGYFRIVFGFVILWTYISLEDYFVNNLSKQSFHFKYDYLEWMQLLASDQLVILFWVLKISAVLFILGIFYRLNAIIQFLGWFYLFFSERGHYNNHFYFYCIVLLFFCFVNADRWMAFRFKKKKLTTVPYWQIFIFQLQIFIVYFYGGIAKLNADWLLGHPMANWLGYRTTNSLGILESILTTYNGALAISYIGLIFDLVIGFFLFSNRLRYFALIPILVFNIMNHFLWRIGTFPWVMIAGTFIFYNPSWPRSLFNQIKTRTVKLPSFRSIINLLFKPPPLIIFKNNVSPKKFILPIIFLYIHFGIQFLLPFRHLLYKGDVAWNGEGHLFSWRMMLVSSDDAVRIRMKFPNDPNVYYVDMFAYMNRGQLNKITKTPKMIIKFIQHLKNEINKSSGITDFEVHLEMYKSVNFRPPQLLNDTTLNYANIQYNYLYAVDWILPWQQTTDDLRLNVKNDAAWKGILFD